MQLKNPEFHCLSEEWQGVMNYAAELGERIKVSAGDGEGTLQAISDELTAVQELHCKLKVSASMRARE